MSTVFLFAFAALAAAQEPARGPVDFSGVLGAEWPERNTLWYGPYPIYAFLKYSEPLPPPEIYVQRFKNGNALYPTAADYLRHMGMAVVSGTVTVMGTDLPLYEDYFEDSFNDPDASLKKGHELFMMHSSSAAFYVVALRAQEQRFQLYKPDFLAFLKSLAFSCSGIKTSSVTAADETMRFSLPGGWSRIHNDEGGILLITQRDASGVRPFISAVFYGQGNPEFKDAQAYIDRYHEPEPITRDWVKTSQDEAFEAGGRPARLFTEEGVDRLPHGAASVKEIPVCEEHVLLPHGAGFYALVLKAPAASFAKLRPAFQNA